MQTNTRSFFWFTLIFSFGLTICFHIKVFSQPKHRLHISVRACPSVMHQHPWVRQQSPQSNLQSSSCKCWIHIPFINTTPLAYCYSVSYFPFLFKSYLGCLDGSWIANELHIFIQFTPHECREKKYANWYSCTMGSFSHEYTHTGPNCHTKIQQEVITQRDFLFWMRP